MRISTLLAAGGAACAEAARRLSATPTFTSSTASAAGSVLSLDLKSRLYLHCNAASESPTALCKPYDGTNLAYGFGAAEQITIDQDTQMLYAVSEQGWVSIVDLAAAATTGPVLKSAFEVTVPGLSIGALTDVEVCTGVHGSFLFVGAAAATKTDPGFVFIYGALAAGSAETPALLHTATAGAVPDMVLPNAACTLLAVANEGEGAYDGALVDPVGSVSFVDLSDFSVTTVALDMGMTDAEMIAAGIHLPLSLDAMEYFDDHSAKFSADLDFTAAREAYTPATQLEPEYLAWSSDGSTLYVGLQENSAIATVDVATRTTTALTALGLKSWAALGIDTDGKDKDCVLTPKADFSTMRVPDAIAAFNVDGVEYVVTANEGDDIEYGDFEEKQKFKDLIVSATAFGSDFAEFTDPDDVLAQAFANFGDTKMRITVGSSGVDYSTPAAPKMRAALGFGGRGISVYAAADMSLVWDSGSDFEKEQCAAYPWAHNSIQDEEFALNRFPGGFLYIASADTGLDDTIDEVNDDDGCADAGDGKKGACPLSGTVDERSLKDGANPESMGVGVACGRLIAVTSTEKSGTAFFYDVTVPTAPELLFVKHLSPASETLSAEVAYTWHLLGDVDAESVVFLEAEHSPSGRAAVVFAGAWSGTVSYYEFNCAQDAVPDETFELNLLHVNDHHSHLVGEKFTVPVEGIEFEIQYGGYARLVSLVAELEKGAKNVLKLHAGDAVTGTSFYSLFKGAADAAAMAEICFDAFALGNHEFDGGDATLAAFIDELHGAETKAGCAAATQVLAANVHPGAASPLVGKIQNSTVFTVGGERVGVVGVDIKGKTMMSSNPSAGTTLSDELKAAQFNINALIAEGVTKIVLLSHVGLGMDEMLAGALSGVDVIIGGDSHSMLGSSASPLLTLLKTPEAAYPYALQNKDGDPVCVGQAWEYSHLLGRMTVTFDAAGVVLACGGDVAIPVAIEAEYPFTNAAGVVGNIDAKGALKANHYFMTQGIIHPVLADASTTAVLADFTAQIDVLSATVIATVPAKICNDRFPGEGRGGCAVAVTAPRGGAAGNLVARSFLQSAPTTDLAIVNSGGVRVSIAAGDYTINDAYTLLPFANMLVTIEMTGAQVVQVLEEAFANVLDNGGSTGGYPYASGLRFDVDASAAAGMRVTNIEVNSRLAAAWTAIAPAATYTVVTTDYLGKGKDGYLTFGAIPDAQKVNLYIDYAQAFMNYAEAEGTLVAPAEAEFSTQSYVGADGVWTGSSPAPTTAPTPAPTTATSGAAAAASASFLGIAAAALLL